MSKRTYKFATQHADLKEQTILLQKQCDEYDRIMNIFDISSDTMPIETQNDLSELSEFLESSGLLFIDISFIMEWHILKRGKLMPVQLALAKINNNIGKLDKHISTADNVYLKTESSLIQVENAITCNGNIDAMLNESKKEVEILAAKKAAMSKKVAFIMDDLLMTLDHLKK